MYASLRDFVSALDAQGELKRIAPKVSPILEISEIADRVSKSRCPNLPSPAARRTDPRFHDRGGHALLFTDVEGSDFPVLINGWGSYRRVEMALGCDPAAGFEGIAARLADLVKPQPPRSFSDLLAALRKFAPLLRMPPKRRRGSGPCQEVVLTGDSIDLKKLPIIRCWPHDGDPIAVGYPDPNTGIPGTESGRDWDRDFRGRYITLAGIHTIHADDRDHPAPPSHNIGMYRVQLLGKNRMVMHWHVHHDGARHWRSWKALGKPMPVAIVFGGESVMPYAATAPMPPGMSELLLAGFLNKGGIPLVRAKTVPLWVPANAEIVIEGFVSHESGVIDWDPRRDSDLGPGAAFEGPFGDHTGFYSLPDRYPLLHVTAITHRRDPIYPTTIVGMPPQEDYYLGKATERIFLPLLRTIVPDIEDYDLPLFGAFHNCAFVKIRKHYPMHARRVMHAIWGAGQMSWTKSVFVVDEGVDVHDHRSVLAAAARYCHPTRDIEKVWGPLDILDHAAPRLGAGMKLGYDCTAKVAGEEAAGPPISSASEPTPASQPSVEAVRRAPGVLAAAFSDGWLFVRADKTAPRQGHALIERIRPLLPDGVRFVVVIGPHVDPGNLDEALFHWCANFDASRDLFEFGDVIAFDATPKLPGDERHAQPVREWPPVLEMTPQIKDQVSKRWAELGLPV
ncbi:4-hydroxy-3-polyprenylbenzoate decarboxylase [Phycisphaerales bacterium]|nr:4-hydroxy-3-polyprenylbenzoate decarboxylase [Phycisphaerales bacterium]